MFSKSGLVAVTTIQYGASPSKDQKVRSNVFLHTARHFKALGIPLLAVVGPCPRGYIQRAHSHNVVLCVKRELAWELQDVKPFKLVLQISSQQLTFSGLSLKNPILRGTPYSMVEVEFVKKAAVRKCGSINFLKHYV